MPEINKRTPGHLPVVLYEVSLALLNEVTLVFLACLLPLWLQLKGLKWFSHGLEYHDYFYSSERPPIYSYFVSDPLHFCNVSFDRGSLTPKMPKPGWINQISKISQPYFNTGIFYLRLSFMIILFTSIFRLNISYKRQFVTMKLCYSYFRTVMSTMTFCLGAVDINGVSDIVHKKGNLGDFNMELNYQQFHLFLIIIVTSQIAAIVFIMIPVTLEILRDHSLFPWIIPKYTDSLSATGKKIFYLIWSLLGLYFGVAVFRYFMAHRNDNFYEDNYQVALIFWYAWLVILYVYIVIVDLLFFLFQRKKKSSSVALMDNRTEVSKKLDKQALLSPTTLSPPASLVDHKQKHELEYAPKKLVTRKEHYSSSSAGNTTFVRHKKLLYTLIASIALLILLRDIKIKFVSSGSGAIRDTCFTTIEHQKKVYRKSLWSLVSPIYYYFSAYPFSTKQEQYRQQVSFFSTTTGKSFDVCRETIVNNDTILDVKYPLGHPFHGTRDMYSLNPRRFFNYFTGTESCSEESFNNVANDFSVEMNDIAYKTTAPVVGPIFHDRGHEDECISRDPELDLIREARNLLDVDGFMSPPPRRDISVSEEETIKFIPYERRRRFPREGRRYSDYDRHTHELLVAAQCPGKGGVNNTPVVIVEDLFRQEFGHVFELINGQWDRRAVSASTRYAHETPNTLSTNIEEKYGRGQCDEVLLNKHGTTLSFKVSNPPKICIAYRMRPSDLFKRKRDYKRSTNIIRVEQRVRELYPIIPANYAPIEAIKNPIYPRPVFRQKNGSTIHISPIPSMPFDHYRIPLLSETAYILCPQFYGSNKLNRDYLSVLNNMKSIEEEYHVHPLPTTLQEPVHTKYKKENCTGVHDDLDHIPNILWMITDSASRLSFLRNLPRVASWLRYHEDKHDIPVVDMKGASTIGKNTYANLAGAVSGVPYYSKLISYKPHQTVFGLAKNKYGRDLMIGMGIDMCDYATNGLVLSDSLYQEYKNVRQKSTNNTLLYPYQLPPVFGGGNSYMDKENDGEFCHHHISGRASSRRGYCSIWKRCIGGSLNPLIKPHLRWWGGILQRVFKRSLLYYLLPSSGSSYEIDWIAGGRHVHDYNMEYLEDGLMILLTVIRKQFKPELFNSSSTNIHVRLLRQDGISEKVLNSYKRFFQVGYFFEAHESTHSVLNQLDMSYYRFVRGLEIVYHYFEPNDPSNPDNKNLMILISDHGPHGAAYNALYQIVERNLPYTVFIGNTTREHRNKIYDTSLVNESDTPKFCLSKLKYQRLHRYTSRSRIEDNFNEVKSMNVASISLTTFMDLYHTICDLLNIECGVTDDIYSQEKHRYWGASIFDSLTNASEMDYYLALYNASNKNTRELTQSESVKGRFSSFLDPVWVNSRLRGHIRTSCEDLNATGFCYKEYCR